MQRAAEAAYGWKVALAGEVAAWTSRRTPPIVGH
jgi:hypothetical protein